jgi:amino acid adenylation domain-containing protein
LERQAERTPDAVACVFGSEEITYRTLDERANQLAHYLRKRGITAESRVGIYLERSIEMVVALLGVLKAGGAYVPLDPAYPAERVGFILEDSEIALLLSQSELLRTLPAQHQTNAVAVDTMSGELAQEDNRALPSLARPQNLAYVLYTSGSTGKPKGVQITHGNLVNFQCSMQREPGLGSNDVLLGITTLSFDIAGLEIYLPLISGARLVLASRAAASDGRLLLDLMARHKPTVMQATPATWRMLIEAGWQGNLQLRVLCGGEALPADLAAQLLPRCAQLWNMYGPTETTIWSSVYRVGSVVATAPIGKPIANTTFYILDGQMQPVPAGVAGELYIGGEGVARGYFHRPELTAEKFVPDPFAADPAARLYRTGDVARYFSDGNVQYLGRTDFQVKIRGFRIELGEIESVLAHHPAVQQVVVAAREDAPGNKRLIAYIVTQPGQHLSTADLRTYVLPSLPDYMIPSAVVELDALPLTPNGKVDRKALPAPDQSRRDGQQGYVAARTPAEEMVAGIWANVLRVERLGIRDDFFELGGHSLNATQVVSRVRDAFRVELPLRAIFETPTVEGLAKTIERLRSTNHSSEIPAVLTVPRNRPLPLSFAQQRLWFLDQMDPGKHLYNVPRAIRMTGALNIEALELSLNGLIARHEILRTTYGVVNDQPVQKIASRLAIALPVIDLSSLTSGEREQQAAQMVQAESEKGFDLGSDPILRGMVIKLGKEDHVLFLNTHHIASDGWSTGVMLNDLSTLYRAALEKKPADLPPLEIQYADYAVWQRNWLQGEVLKKQMAFWKSELVGAPPLLALPTDHPRPAVQTFRGAVHESALPKNLVESLRLLGRQQGSTLFMTLLAGFEALIYHYTGQPDLVLGTDLANRTTVQTEALIGFFVNLLVLRTDVSGNPTFEELTKRVREVTLRAYAHQDLPFDKLVEELRPERNLTHSPLVQVLFVQQNTPRSTGSMQGLKMERFPLDVPSKFDMAVFIGESADHVVGRWVYNPDLFDASTVARMAGLYEVLLRAVASESNVPLSRIYDALGEAEQRLRAAEQKSFHETSLRKLKGAKRKVAMAPANTEGHEE